jgi:predicted transcriptional regulator
VRLPAGQRQKLKEYAYSTGRSLSGIITQAIRELLEREGCDSVEV